MREKRVVEVGSRISYLSLCLVLFSCILVAAPVCAASVDVTQGTVGSVITIYSLPPSQSYIVQWDGVTSSSGTSATTGTATFTVPEATGGTHSLVVQCPVGTQAFSGSFVVTPSITISPDSGAVGTTVSISGKGFAASESSITVTYDATSVKTSITADSNGSWSTTLAIPNSAKSSHTIDAYGTTTAAASVTDKTFSVKPAISVSPLNGGVGTTVTVSGSGFVTSESGISVTYDSKSVKSGIVADSYGAWSTSFAIPKSSSGSHVVDASGTTTALSDVTDITFSVSPGISIDKTSASVGDTITITGTGFGQYESNIFATFDGVDKGSSVSADDSGEWLISMAVPSLVNGTHTVSAHGTVTSVSSVLNKTLSVTAKIVLNPQSGNVGDTVTVVGNGFKGTQTITVSYGTVSVISGATDAAGQFSGTFKAPGGKSGAIQVVATDAASVTASGVFTMETTPPPMPQIVSPKPGSMVGFIGDTKVTFKWSTVTDPSGVSYELQVASDSNFTDVAISHPNLTTPVYESTDAEALSHGQYYWRIRAIDGAGNASGWTTPAQLKAALMTVTTFVIVVIVVGIVILLIIWRALVVFRRP